MITYRLCEIGVERIENGRSTFVSKDQNNAAWLEYESWLACGFTPAASPAVRAIASEPTIAPPVAPPLPPLYIIGAGGFGRQVFSALHSIGQLGVRWNIAGFLNDLPDALDGFEGYAPIVDTMFYDPKPGDLFFCALGNPTARQKITARFLEKGARFINLVQPHVMYPESTKWGQGILVENYVGIGVDNQIGDFTQICSFCAIAHDVKIGKSVQISPSVTLTGWVEIGDGAMIGAGATILPRVKIGAGATVGAGSLVIKDVPAGATVFGVPAKRLV